MGKRARAAPQDHSGDERKTAVASQRRVTTAATQLAAGGLGAGVAPPSRRRQCSGRFAGVLAPPAAGGSPAHSSHSPHVSVIDLQAAAGQAAVLLQPDQRLLASDDVLYPLPLLEKVRSRALEPARECMPQQPHRFAALHLFLADACDDLSRAVAASRRAWRTTDTRQRGVWGVRSTPQPPEAHRHTSHATLLTTALPLATSWKAQRLCVGHSRMLLHTRWLAKLGRNLIHRTFIPFRAASFFQKPHPWLT